MATKIEKKVVLVTGANQGLGFEVIHVLALREPYSVYILCSRDVSKVLVNNAGISPVLQPAKDSSPAAMREAYSYLINTNLISAYVISKASLSLLQKGKDPKAVNVTSRLGSMEFNLKSPMVRGHRSVEYGSSKVALNGVTAHMQAGENDRCGAIWDYGSKAWGQAEKKEGYVTFYVAQPGTLKTAFNGFREGAKSPELGAEVISRLAIDGQDGKYYPGGTYWKCDVDEMEEVPW
ncbi:NAD(P)-binding protein [Acephala macrosclerotiorum]|nr:NAD(P)-binding protein [Acephala macrosclerotiorum]